MQYSNLKMLLPAILTAVSFVLTAAEQRIATVNLEKAFNGYYKTKIIDQEFAEQRKVYSNYLERQTRLLRKDEQIYRQKRDASLNVALAPAERQRRQQEVENLEKSLKKRWVELEQYVAERTKALQESSARERKKVIEDIRSEIRRRAAIEGYTLVLDSSGMSLNDTSIVLYSTDAMDITDKVLTELNRTAGKKSDNTTK